MLTDELNRILANVSQGIDLPPPRDHANDHAEERLVEYVEIQNYPHPSLTCPHQAQLQISEDCVECQLVQYETYRSRFLSLVEEKGYGHTHTLKAAFDYYSSLITQYRLTECDALLDQIYDACLARGTWSSYYIMAIQARSFLRFKQGRYQESVELFKLQLDVLGPNERVYENMALAYARLGESSEAAACYGRAILMIQQKAPEEQHLSTLLMGLSAVLEDTQEALAVLDGSMQLLEAQYGKPHSLMAKALTAMGDLHIKRQDLRAAEAAYAKAVLIFIDTCGYETPLTANAMTKHADLLSLLDKKPEALARFLEALKVWTQVDAQSFDPNMVAKIVWALRDIPKAIPETKPSAAPTTPATPSDAPLPNLSGKRQAASKPMPMDHQHLAEITQHLVALQAKITQQPGLAADLNVICILKFMYELHVMYGNIPQAINCCEALMTCLTKIDASTLGELAPVRDQLLQESKEMLTLMQTIPARK